MGRGETKECSCGAKLYWRHDILYGWHWADEEGKNHRDCPNKVKCPVCDEGYVDNSTQSRHEIECFECPICNGWGEITQEILESIPKDYDPIQDIIDNQIMAAEYAWEASIGK